MMRFRVAGTPAPQGSKRHVGGGRMVEMSKAVGPWREAVRAEAQRVILAHQPRTPSGGFVTQEPVRSVLLAPALSVTIVFVLARPKSHYSTRRWQAGSDGPQPGLLPSAPAYPAKRPDVDKLARAVLDGLVMGGVMADDAQVVSLSAVKTYASDGEAPGAVIDVEAMT